MTEQNHTIYRSCRKCGTSRPLDDFYADKHWSSGYRSECKECVREYVYERRSLSRPPRVIALREFRCPSSWLKPGEPLMAGDYDFAWCFSWFKEVPWNSQLSVGWDGSVWSRRIRRCKSRLGEWSKVEGWKQKDGYLEISIPGTSNGRILVHNLILLTFVGPCPDGMLCRHLDGDPSNNRLWNIRWGTQAENCADRERHGRTAKGSRFPQSKLTESDIPLVRQLVASGASRREAGRIFGVHHTVITRIIKGESWMHVPERMG